MKFTINKICKKLNFNSGFCQFAVKFLTSFLCGEVLLVHDRTFGTLGFPVNCLSLRRALVFLLLLYILKLILAYAE